MSNTIPVSEPAATAQATPIDLGMPPVYQCMLALLVVGPGLLIVGLLLGYSGMAGAIFAVLSMIPWILCLMFLGIRLITLLVTGGGLSYRRTKAAIREGRIGLTYFIRDMLGDTVIVADETRRLICVNGDVFSFDDVKNIAWQSGNGKNKLEFALTSGASPIRIATLSSENALKVAYQRLCNTLGLTE